MVTEIRTDEAQLSSLLDMLEKQYDPERYIIEFNDIKTGNNGNLKDGLHSIIPVISVFIIPLANMLLLLSIFMVHDFIWKLSGIVFSVILLAFAIILLRRVK